jgi:hypothetical protein
MKKPAAALVVCALLFFAVVVLPAQEPVPAPKPGPEHQKLAYYVGKWNSEGDIKASAAGPAGKYAYTETCDWLPGKFAILCKQDGNMMGGEFHGTSIMSYDAMQNSYVYYATNNWGENSYYHGTVDGDTWTWLNEGKVSGQTVSARFVLKQVSPDLANFSFALAFGAQPLNNIMEGKQTRQK